MIQHYTVLLDIHFKLNWLKEKEFFKKLQNAGGNHEKSGIAILISK